MPSGTPARSVSYGQLVGGKRFNLTLSTTAKRKPASQWTVLGKPVPNPDLAALVTGQFQFVHNVRVPGMLHAALHLTEHARADIRRIDTSRAAAAPGVVAVYTAADIPGEQYVGIIYKDWPVFIGEGQRTSYAGDVLAIVVADTKQHARAAAALIDVDYDVLRPITDAVAAITDPEVAVYGTKGNVLSVSAYQRGDTDAALASSAHVVHEVFQTQRIEHAFLEPESTLAVPSRTAEGGRHLHVYSGGQGVWDDRDQIASLLALGHESVTVELVSNGGAFGGKEDMSNQGQTALAAWLLDRPVKCTLSREESFRIHAKRHPIRLEYWAGCDTEGHLTALRVRGVGDSGSYASVGMKVLERAAGHASGPYRVSNIDVECTAVRTNNPVCGAFRGFGANQAQFAMEGVIDRLAEQVGISGWEMRKRNVIHPGEVWGPGQIMDDGAAGAEECLDRAQPHIEAALAAGNKVALANKESLVAGGELVVKYGRENLIPVDSEHSAIYQSMKAGKLSEVKKLVLTASGGPFRSREDLSTVTVEDALAHPTWNMGQVVTINSATLVNKGLEIIEAHYLFGMPYQNIEAVIHPQSIIHSMVEFVDGSTISQASPPNMKGPIAYALGLGERVPSAMPPINWSKSQSWEFEPIDEKRFPSVRIAREVGEMGSTFTAIFNAANEVAVDAFIQGAIGFTSIIPTVIETLERLESEANTPLRDLSDVSAIENNARACAAEIARKKGVSK